MKCIYCQEDVKPEEMVKHLIKEHEFPKNTNEQYLRNRWSMIGYSDLVEQIFNESVINT